MTTRMNNFSKKTVNGMFLIISMALLVGSFTQKCYCTIYHCVDSLAALISGTAGFFCSWAGATWLANPLLITSWILIKRNSKLSLITSLLASLIALSFLLFTKVLDNENGDLNEIISYKLGYWLWVSSSSTMLIGNTISYFSKRTNR
ncbi:MAG: hypothetical protein JWR02_3023 [Mucilaginibacter sp.]|nr:hypothetical protein [Mucilaginibacter sp.]